MSWQPIETAPTDRTRFLAFQAGEVWRAYGEINPDTGKVYFVRRTHERRQERTYVECDVRIDGVVGKHKVLVKEVPDDLEFNWVIWSRGFDFAPTHWMPLPEPPAIPNMKESA